MRIALAVATCVTVTFALVAGARAGEIHDVASEGSSIADLRITILYDNYRHTEGTRTDWGFSCLIQGPGKTILFDTGTRPEILMDNVAAMKVDLTEVDLIVISHDHGDHTRGLLRVLQTVSDIPVYLPHSFPYDFVRRVERAGCTVVPVREPVEICPGIHLTGEMGDAIKEQAIVLDTTSGLVVVTGCAHPGIDKVVQRAREIIDRKIHLVLGGFHLMRHSEEQLQPILAAFRAAGVVSCSPTHCSGDDAIAFFRRAYGEDYLPAGAGQVFTITGPSPQEAASTASSLEDELRATEQAFARTMADRDHEAFSSFLAEDTIFFGRDGQIRGKAAVAAAWKPLHEGDEPPFSWQPEAVAVLDSGTLGLTSGPILDAAGARIGTFNSVWRREADGSWRIVFDRGCPPCSND